MSETLFEASAPSPDLQTALLAMPADQRDFARAVAALALERHGAEPWTPGEIAIARASSPAAANALRDEALLRDSHAASATDHAWSALEAFGRDRTETARFFLSAFDAKARMERENGVNNRSRWQPIFKEIATRAIEKTNLASWTADASGRAPSVLEHVQSIWEHCDREEMLAHALCHLARQERLDRREGHAESADLAPLAFERAISWAWKRPISELSDSAVCHLMNRWSERPALFLLERGAPVGLKSWQELASFKCFSEKRFTEDAKRQQESLFRAFVDATRPAGERPAFLDALFVSAFSKENDAFLRKLVEQWPPEKAETFALLHFFARHETTIDDGEMFQWQKAHKTDYGEYRGPDDWLSERLGLLERFDRPGPNAMGFLFETATDHHAQRCADFLLAHGAPAAGFAGSGLPLAEHLRRRDFKDAEKIAAAGGWGPDGEKRILAMQFGPYSQDGADFAKAGWAGRAQASFDARELAREVTVAKAAEAVDNHSAHEAATAVSHQKLAHRL